MKTGVSIGLFSCLPGDGYPDELEAARLQLQFFLSQLSLYQAQLGEVEEKVAAAFLQLPEAQVILTIPGLSAVQAAIIMAELGDLRRYQHPTQLHFRA
jgi:transposase